MNVEIGDAMVVQEARPAAAVQALQERKQARLDLASASTAIARRIASIAWLRNERRLAVQWSDARDSSGGSKDRALCKQIRKLRAFLADKPDELLPHLDRLEGAQPRSEKLATAMADIERCLMGF